MLLKYTLEYLFYISIFIFFFKCTTAASINLTEHMKKDTLKKGFDECETELSWMCLKLEFVRLMERLSEQNELQLMSGVSVVKDVNATETKTSEIMAEVARSYPNDPSSRLNGFLLAKLGNYLQTRHLRLNLIDNKALIEARSFMESGRKGKFGKKGGLEALVAAGLMMKGTLMALGLKAIAFMAGKALMTALMALTISSILGLKSLAHGGGKSTTYEIVAKPVYTSSHSHSVSHDDHGHSGGGGGSHYSSGHSGSGYGGYSRSLNLNLPQKS